METDEILDSKLISVEKNKNFSLIWTELILVSLAIIGLVFMFLHGPGAGVLLVSSLSLLALIYQFLGFAVFNGIRIFKIFKKKSYEGISSSRVFGAIGVGIALGISVIGILFALMHYPGARINLLFGGACIATLIVVILLKGHKIRDSYYKLILKRLVAWGFVSALLILIPSKTFLTWKYPNNPEYVQALIDIESDPQNIELQKKAWRLREEMFETPVLLDNE